MITKKDWKINPENTAFITIDMQRSFLEQGSPVACDKTRGFVHGINDLTALCRATGIPVIHVYGSYLPDLSDIGLLQEIRPRTDSEWEVIAGRKGKEFYGELNISESDYTIKKIRYSAFIPGSSEIEPLLRRLNRNTLIICGVATDVCVLATTIDAMMMEYRVFFIGDLTATFNAERQKVALEVLDRHFAKVVSYNEVKADIKSIMENGKG